MSAGNSVAFVTMRKRLDLAFDLLRPAEWERFEDFSSEFLAVDHPGLRTVASPGGDGGRDAFLWVSDARPTVFFQYSIAEDWRAKIRATAATVKPNFPQARVLTYVTSQRIGAAADDLILEIEGEHDLMLDIRDRTWFLDRVTDPVRDEIAEALASDVVDPYLRNRGEAGFKASALSSSEAQAACVYLALQWEDETRDKGLTKLAFEALVRAVLRDTSSEKRVDRPTVHARVSEILESQDADIVSVYVDAALARLEKTYIRHWRNADEFCLTSDERVRIAARLEEFAIRQIQFAKELEELLREAMIRRGDEVPTNLSEPREILQATINRFLLTRGELFAAAVQSGEFKRLAYDRLRDHLVAVLGEGLKSSPQDIPHLEAFVDTVEQALLAPSAEMQRYLRSLADSYTMFSFLQETPDIQGAIGKMFSSGEIWLDTTVVLPLFAEQLLETPASRLYTNIVRAAHEAGLKLRMTPGVLEEVDRHMNKAKVYATQQWGGNSWRGRVPFLYAAYAFAGRARDTFATWLEEFRGTQHPEDDLAEFLNEEFGVEIESLSEQAERTSTELRGAVQEVWHKAHEKRRVTDVELDRITIGKLVDHDVENYLGVVQKRTQQRRSAFGYTSWWLTLDSLAYTVRERIRNSVEVVPDSPVMSPDFLANYLAIGPARSRVRRDTESLIPVVLEMSELENIPQEVIDIADEVREANRDAPERVIRRRVRDTLDIARARPGRLVTGGLEGMEQSFEKAARSEG